MKGTDIALVLIVLGVGGLAIWFLTRPKDVADGKVPSKGLCEAGVELGAGAASKGQVSVGQQSTAICDLSEKVLTGGEKALSTLSGGIGKTAGFTTDASGKSCEGAWAGRMTAAKLKACEDPASKSNSQPVAPLVRTAAQRSTLLSSALGSTPTRKL